MIIEKLLFKNLMKQFDIKKITYNLDPNKNLLLKKKDKQKLIKYIYFHSTKNKNYYTIYNIILHILNIVHIYKFKSNLNNQYIIITCFTMLFNHITFSKITKN